MRFDSEKARAEREEGWRSWSVQLDAYNEAELRKALAEIAQRKSDGFSD
jgi:hypothetical protein